MVVYFLQTRFKTLESLGEALFDFFYCFGYEYDYLHRTFVGPAKPQKDMSGKGFLLPSQNIQPQGGYHLIIQDPLNPNYDAGRKISRILEIKVTNL